ncbi:MAG: metallophosphoesterase [Lachnospiraceae bacterium]
MIYYISDLHIYNQVSLTDKDCRPFDTLEEMHNCIIRKWNARVTNDDLVIVLGDLSNADAKLTNEFLKQLHGRIALLIGNHDHYVDDPEFDRSRFEWIDEYREILDKERHVILCHYPVMFYNYQYKTLADGSPMTYMLYGHLHDSMDEGILHHFQNELRQIRRTIKRTGRTINTPSHMINCFCMFSDYTPLTLDEWIENDRRRRSTVDCLSE